MVFPDKVSTFTDRLNLMLRERGLAQADLVKATGIERSRISTYCSGKNDPKFEPVYRIALFLKVNVAWLMGYDVPMEENKQIDDSEFSNLNQEGKDKVEAYIEDLLDNPKYRKETKKEKIA